MGMMGCPFRLTCTLVAVLQLGEQFGRQADCQWGGLHRSMGLCYQIVMQ